MHVTLDAQWRVTIHAAATVPMSTRRVWQHARRFVRFTSLDALHGLMQIEGGRPRQGAALMIHHGFAGVRLRRVGRILRWAPGQGYSFSDLSRRGVRVGFPHIYSYDLDALGTSETRVRLTIRGKWTARRLPRWAVRLWLRWVTLRSIQKLGNHLLLSELRRRTATPPRRPGPRPSVAAPRSR